MILISLEIFFRMIQMMHYFNVGIQATLFNITLKCLEMVLHKQLQIKSKLNFLFFVIKMGCVSLINKHKLNKHSPRQ